MNKIKIKYNSHFNKIVQLFLWIVSTALDLSAPFTLIFPTQTKSSHQSQLKFIIIYDQIYVCFFSIVFVLYDISVFLGKGCENWDVE